jgi:hypothetical protein
MTALGMVETMRREGHSALVHTAAASNLGQMLVRLCRADGVPLVNVVRRPEQVSVLSALGATRVVDSSQPGFRESLTEATAETGATLAFDAVGGGTLASEILGAMEAAAARSQPGYRRYGTTVHKQVYLYGVPRSGSRGASADVGDGLGRGGLAGLARPREARPRGSEPAPGPGGRGGGHDLRQPLLQGNLAHRDAPPRGDRRVRAGRHRLEVPGETESGLRPVEADGGVSVGPFGPG